MSTIKKVKVRNMESSNGNQVPNQFTIETDEGVYFQSYDSLIAFKITDREHHYPVKVWLDSATWDYSKTTGKYRNQFLNESKRETQAKIDSGEYVLTDLN